MTARNPRHRSRWRPTRRGAAVAAVLLAVSAVPVVVVTGIAVPGWAAELGYRKSGSGTGFSIPQGLRRDGGEGEKPDNPFSGLQYRKEAPQKKDVTKDMAPPPDAAAKEEQPAKTAKTPVVEPPPKRAVAAPKPPPPATETEPVKTAAQLEAETAGELAAEVAAETAQRQELPPKTYNGCSSAQSHSDQQIAAEHRNRVDWAEMQKVASEARLASADRAKALIHQSADINLDGMLYAKPTAGSLIALINSVAGLYHGGVAHAGGEGNNVGGTVTRKKKKDEEEDPPVAGPQGPAVLINEAPCCTPPPPPPPPDPDKEKPELDAVDDLASTDYRKRVRGNVMGNDEHDGSGRVSLISRTKRGAMVLYRSGNWRYKNYPTFRDGGTDSFTYMLTDSSGETDVATVTIEVGAKERKKKKKGKGGGGRGGGGRGGGGGGGGGGGFTPFSCRETAERYSGLDPDVIAAKFGADQATQQAYTDAADDLLPEDRAHNQVDLAHAEMQTAMASGAGEVELDLAQAKYKEAVGIQRNVVDATVQDPLRTFTKLVESSATSGGAIPVHPLLEPSDGAAAAQLMKQVRDPEIQGDIAKLAPMLSSYRPGDTLPADLNSAVGRVYQRLAGADLGTRAAQRVEVRTLGSTGAPLKLAVEVPVLGAQVLPSKDMDAARAFVTRVAGAMPLLAKLEDGVRNAAGKAPVQYLEQAAAQVLYSEVVGKERLLAAREITTAEAGRTVGVSLDQGRAVKEVALTDDMGLRQVQDLRPLDQQRMAFHDGRITMARTLQADAEVAVAKSLYAGKKEQLATRVDLDQQNLVFATRDLAPQVQKAAMELPEMQKTLNAARMTALQELKAGNRIEGLEVGLKKLTAEVDSRRAVLDGAAAKSPILYQALNRFDTSTEVLQDETLRLSTDAGYAKVVERAGGTDVAGYTQELTQRIARTGTFGVGANSVLRGADGTITKQSMDNFTAFAGQAPALTNIPKGPMPGDFSRAAPDAEIRAGDAAGAAPGGNPAQSFTGQTGAVFKISEVEETLRGGANLMVAGNSGGVYSKEVLDDPDQLEQILRDRVAGNGVVHRFNSDEEMRDIAQARLGGLGVARLRSEIEKPENFVKEFNQAVGGLGWAHEFESVEALQQFAQERVGGLGMVHRRSDLEDPEYRAKLMEERLGPFVAVHRFDNMEQMRDFVQSRLGGLGRAYTCLDLLDAGWSEDQVDGMFDRAREYGARDFETKAQWEERMMAEHEDDFVRDPNTGKVRFKTPDEIRRERETEMLASGDFIRDPRTGNLVRADSKAGAQVKRAILENKPKRVKIKLADGRDATLTIDGFTSLTDALADALRAQGYTQDAAGNWLDGNGNLVITGESVRAYDDRYTTALEEQYNGVSSLLTRRPPPPPPTPPTTADSLTGLADQVADSFGYTARNIELGGRMIDIEVRPGETFTEALARTLEGQDRFAFDAAGNLVDTKTGALAWGADELAERDDKYRERVLAAVFGQGQGGLNEDVLWLARYGAPAQKQRAQQILDDLSRRAEAVQKAEAAQRAVQDKLAALDADATLSAREKRRQREALLAELDQATRTRKEVEQGLIDQATTANESATRAQAASYTREERKVIELTSDAKAIEDDIRALEEQKRAARTETQRKRLQQQIDKKLAQLYGLDQKIREARVEVENPARLDGRVPDLEIAADRFSGTTAADWRDAKDRAVAVGYVTIDGEKKAVYLGPGGAPFRDPAGNLIAVPPAVGEKYNDQIAARLAKEKDYYDRNKGKLAEALAAEARTRDEIAALQQKARDEGRELKGWEKTKLANLQKKLAQQKGDVDEIATRIRDRTLGYAALQALAVGADGAVNEDVKALIDLADAKAVKIQEDREANQRAYDTGAATITYEIDGVKGEYKTEKARVYEREQAEKAKAAAEAAAEKLAAEAVQAAQEMARAAAEKVQREQAEARRKAEEYKRQMEAQGRALRGQFTRYEDELISAEGRQATAAAALAAAAKDLELARAGRIPNTPELQKRYKDAQAALRKAEDEVAQKRMVARQAQALASTNDPAVLARMNAQGKAIQDAAKAYAAAQELAAAKYKALREVQADPKATPEQIRRAREAYEAASRAEGTARQGVVDRQNVLGTMIDNALYTSTTPDYNKARLAQLEARAGDKGTQKGLTPEENEEYWRRRYIQQYFDKVDAASDKLANIKRVREAYARDPKSVSIADQDNYLYASLTQEEMVILTGERQRQDLLRDLSTAKDPALAAVEAAHIGEWMTSGRGGLGGKSLLHNDNVDQIRQELFGALDGRAAAQKDLVDARQQVTDLRAELAAAEAAFKKDPSDYTRRQVGYAQDLLYGAERRVRWAEDGVRKAEGDAKAVDEALSGNALLQHRQDRLTGAAGLVAERQAKLATALAASAVNPTGANLHETRMAQENLTRALEMLSDAQKGLAAMATGNSDSQGTGVRAPSYLDLLRADAKVKDDAARAQRQAEEQQYAAAREREYEALQALAKIKEADGLGRDVLEARRTTAREDLARLQTRHQQAVAAGDKTKVADLERQIALQTRVEMGYDGAIRQQDADRRYASARLELARLRVAQAKAEEAGNSDEVKRLKKLVAQQQAVMTYQETYAANLRNQNIVDFNDAATTLVPREWEVSAQYKAQEEQYRFSRAVDIQRRLKQQDQQRAAAEGQIRQEIDTLDDQVTALQIARGDLLQKKRDGKIDAEEADEQLASLAGQIGTAQQMLSDARAALGYRSGLFDNGDRNLREEWDAFVSQNRKDGVGPTSEHDVNVLARDHGVNLDAIYLTPAEVIERQRRGGSELVTLYQDQEITGEKDSWSDLFVDEFNVFREDSTIRQAASLPWLGKTLVANTVGLGKGLYGMVEGGVKLALGTAEATYESIGILAGADIETDTLDSINNVLKVVDERGVGRIVHDIKEDFFRKLNKGDAVWNRGVAGGQIAAEVVAAALSGGSGTLVKVATGLEKTAVALSRTARVLDKVSDLARIGGEVANTAGRWSRASEYAADGLRVLAGRAISADSTLRAGARTLVGGLVEVADRPASLVARAVPEALQPGILPALRTGLARASLHEVQNAQNMATALRRAENLLGRAAKSNKTDEIASLVDEAMALKRTAQSFFDANPKAMDVLAEVGGLTNDVARLNPQRAAAALARRADLAEAGGDLAGSVALRRASIAAAAAADAPDAATLALRKAAQDSRDRRALAVLDDFVPDAAADPDAVAGNLRRAFQGDGVADTNLRRKADELAQSAALRRDALAREADKLERALANAPDEAREAGLRAVKAKRDQAADLDRVERVMRNLRDGADEVAPGPVQVARAAPDGTAAATARQVDAEIPDADRPMAFDGPEVPSGPTAVGTPDAKKALNRPRGPPQVAEPVQAADVTAAARTAEANARLARRAADTVPGGKVDGDDLKAAREAYDDVLRKARDDLATPDEVRAARQEYARLNTRDTYAKARKDAADDLALRQSILTKAAEDPDALKTLSKADLDWLSGKRKDLTPDEEAWADELIRANGGDWFKVSKALNEGLSELEMHKLVTYRKKVVDDMLDAAIREVEQETGHKLSRQAFGSTNLTSDYDLSVTGWGAEKVVGKFNAAFRKKFGREPGLFFDTNVYTDPVYNVFSRQALRQAGLDLPPTELDEFRQFLFDQMATRKYLNDQQWAQHVKILESTAPDEATRDLIRNAARQVDGAEAAARARLNQRMHDIARRTGQDIGHKNVELQAKNELYEEVLGSIDEFRGQHDFLSRLGPKRLDLEMPASSLTGEGTAYAEAVKKIRRLYAEGDIVGADALKAETLGRLQNQMRNRQGTALYYASEAYQTQGTIAHVVGELQAGGKPITFASLTVPKRRDVVPDPDAVNGYLNSFNENRANMFKELNDLVDGAGAYGDNAAKAAGKVGKYFIRQLDAAASAGVDLTKVLPDRLIRATLTANAKRSSKSALKSALKEAGYTDIEDFVRQAESASHLLLREGMKISPLRKLAPAAADHRREVDALLRSVGAFEPGNRAAVKRTYATDAIPDEVSAPAPTARAAVDLDSRKADDIAQRLRGRAEDLRRTGADGEQVRVYEELATEAQARADRLRVADYRRALSGRENAGLRERITGGAVDDRALRRDLAAAEADGADAAVLRHMQSQVDATAARRADVAKLLDETPDWETMSKKMPTDDPELAASLSDFREWAWDQVQRRWPNTVRTGTSGKMGNDLDFSVTGPNAGRDQLAIEKFLAEEIEVAPGVRGLGSNWDKKLHSTAFGDPELIHIYDRLTDPAQRIAVRDGLAEMVEAAQLARLKHSMTPESWTAFKRSIPEVDAEALIARHPLPDDFDRAGLLLARDEAYQRLVASGFRDADAAARVSRIQVTLNRNDPEAYLSFGGVKQTVTFKEGLVKFDQPLVARMENGRVAVRPDPDATEAGLLLRLPGQRAAPRRFSSVNDLRRYLGELKGQQPGVRRVADQLVVQRTINELEDTVLRVDPGERYQSVLGNIAFFEHQIEEAGGDALTALRRYQTSKYLDRVLSEAYEMGVPARAYEFLGEAKSLARRFYKERDPTIARFFGTETTALDAEDYARLQTKANELLGKLRDLNNDIAARARRDAQSVLRHGRDDAFVPAADDPARFLDAAFGRGGKPASDAYRMARNALGEDAKGLFGDFARRDGAALRLPDGVETIEDARLFNALARDLPEAEVARLSPNERRLYNLRRDASGPPAPLRVATPEADPAKLARLQARIFDETGVLVDFVSPDGGDSLLAMLPRARAADLPGATAGRAVGGDPFGGNGGRVPGWNDAPGGPAAAGRPAPPADNGARLARNLLDERDLRAAADARLRAAIDGVSTGGRVGAAAVDAFRQARRLSAAQAELDRLLTAARANGVPEAAIARLTGTPDAFERAPMVARQAAVRGLEEEILRRAGRLVPDAQVGELRRVLTRAADGTATAADDALLRRWITASARNGDDFLGEVTRRGRVDFDRGFEPVAGADLATRARAYAEAKNLIAHSETPTLWNNPNLLQSPTRGRGTPPQFYNDTCGLMAFEGVLRDRGMVPKLRSEQALRDAARDASLFEPGKGMTRAQLTDWINGHGGDVAWAGRKPTALELRGQLDADRDLIVMIRTGSDSYHWVRVENFEVSATDGRLWVAVGDPGSGKTWSTPADLFDAQVQGDNVLAIDWRQARAAAGAGQPVPRGRVARNAGGAGPAAGGGGGPDGEPAWLREVLDGEERVPKAGETWSDGLANPSSFKIGRRLGGGSRSAYAKAFELESHPDEVIKFVPNRREGGEVETLFENMRRAQDTLREAGIPHLPISRFETGAQVPYMVQRKAAGRDYDVFSSIDKAVESGRWTDAHGSAVIELFDRLAAAGIRWDDPRMSNIYFKRLPDGSVEAGVLDIDRLARVGEESAALKEAIDIIQTVPWSSLGGVRSLTGVKYDLSDPRYFMMKMFERKKWVSYDPDTGTWSSRLLDFDAIEKKFPGLRRDVGLQGGQARTMGGLRRRRRRRKVPPRRRCRAA